MRRVRAEDLKEINTWRNAREASILENDSYPPTGLIEPNVAAAFINFTQTNPAFIENVVSNPKADQALREQTIMRLLEALEKIAYDFGIAWIVAVTSHSKIEKYIYEFKGERLPGKFYGKRVTHGSR